MSSESDTGILREDGSIDTAPIRGSRGVEYGHEVRITYEPQQSEADTQVIEGRTGGANNLPLTHDTAIHTDSGKVYSLKGQWVHTLESFHPRTIGQATEVVLLD